MAAPARRSTSRYHSESESIRRSSIMIPNTTKTTAAGRLSRPSDGCRRVLSAPSDGRNPSSTNYRVNVQYLIPQRPSPPPVANNFIVGPRMADPRPFWRSKKRARDRKTVARAGSLDPVFPSHPLSSSTPVTPIICRSHSPVGRLQAAVQFVQAIGGPMSWLGAPQGPLASMRRARHATRPLQPSILQHPPLPCLTARPFARSPARLSACPPLFYSRRPQARARERLLFILLRR